MSILISTNPANKYEEVGSAEITTKEQISVSVASAQAVFETWKELGCDGRRPYFKKFIEVFKPRINEIAELQSKEMGKPIEESKGEAESLVGWLENQLQIASEMLAPQITDSFDDYEVLVYREPFGVVASIAPWNYPTFQMALAVFPQLIAGNTVVFKHSEECVLTSKLIASLFAEAGFPEGVFTTIYGSGEVGQMLLAEDVQLIHFTGSTRVGQEIYKIAAAKFIPAVLEMGGSSPGILFADADIDKACLSVFSERNANSGQVCSALKRLFVHVSIYDEVVNKLKQIAEQQVIGDPLKVGITMGPLAAERQVMELERQVQDARTKGATIVCGGIRPEGLEGAFYESTVLTNVTNEMAVMKEEVFGPVLPVIPFETEEEVIKMANDTEYGLSAFVYTSDLDKASRVALKLESGQVSINGKLFFSDNSPFGGYKKSGIGRGDGKIGYHYITQTKVVAKPK